jgi:hypothetical protein
MTDGYYRFIQIGLADPRTTILWFARWPGLRQLLNMAYSGLERILAAKHSRQYGGALRQLLTITFSLSDKYVQNKIAVYLNLCLDHRLMINLKGPQR